MIRRPPRSTQSRSSAASDVYKRQAARSTMTAAGVPVTPGSEGIIESAAEAEAVTRRIGLPVMVKASAGGGGKGIRIVKEASELAAAVRQAQGEAEAAFGNGAVYVEKYIGSPRHIEIQVLAEVDAVALAATPG